MQKGLVVYSLFYESLVLTAKAKSIFGDIVQTAYYTTGSYENREFKVDKNNNRWIEMNESSERSTIDDGNITYDGCDISILFTNGRCVSFTSSDWADMSLFSSTGLENEKERITFFKGEE